MFAVGQATRVRGEGWVRQWLPLAIVPWMLALSERTVHAQASDTTCATVISGYRRAVVERAAASAIAARRMRMIACIDSADKAVAMKALGATTAEGARLARAFFEIPEYHDEGRLPAAGNLLGPMAHIYASPELGGFATRSQIYEQGMPGLLAAIVEVANENTNPLPATYQALNLRKGVNCIWLNLPNPASGVPYRAYVSYPPANTACRARDPDHPDLPPVVTGELNNQPLKVLQVRDANRSYKDHYPAAARFDTDETRNQPILAFKCLEAFCEVGPPGVVVKGPAGLPNLSFSCGVSACRLGDVNSNQNSINSTLHYPAKRIIKGWHDEQDLAYRDNNNVWRRTGILATVTPEENAGLWDASQFNNTYRRVANIVVHTDVPAGKYADWGLKRGVNEVWLRESGGQWQMQIRRAGAVIKNWLNGKRMIHYDAAVPATARFRWTAADDGIWVPCGNACCTADGT